MTNELKTTQIDAPVDENASLTKNGAATRVSSLNKCVDLFFLIGSSRGKDITPAFQAALAEDAEVATRILQWARDVRGGAGERGTFRALLASLISANENFAQRIMPKVPEIGRWDDLFVYFGTNLETEALRLISRGLLIDRNGLCAKWIPRKGDYAKKIRAYLQLTPKSYRKLLVGLTDVVEQKMCAKEFDQIEFEKVPSLAAARYQQAFTRNAGESYGRYLASLEKGEAKINAGAVYPYDVVKSLRSGDTRAANAQWSSLPDYLEGSDERILPVVDVSGSMSCPAGNTGSTTCMDVAISLGLYLSERSESIFKDCFVTFSSVPSIQKVTGSLEERYRQMQRADWAMSTNVAAVFDLILNNAVKHKISPDQLPTKVLILSDMEFDQCVTVSTSHANRYWGGGRSDNEAIVTAMDAIEQKYKAAGYAVPQIVFWNLNGRAGNVPVEYNKAGAALVSGFSPSIMKSLLGGKVLTPHSVMFETVMIDRYDF